MLFKQETTIGALAEELNRWLKMKWSHADYNRELPTSHDLYSYVQKLMPEMAAAYRHGLAEEDLRLCAAAGRPELHLEHITFFVLTMLDTHLLTEPEPALEFFSWMAGEQMPVIRFALEVKRLDMEGDACDAVKSVSVPLPQVETPLMKLFCDLLNQQFAAEPDPAARWLAAPAAYRERHLMCPVCGGSELHVCKEDSYGSHSGPIACDYCDWISDKERFYYRSDLANEAAFKRELKYLRQKAAFKAAVQTADNAFQTAVDTLTKEMEKAPKKAYYRNDAICAVQEWVKKLTAIQNEWTAQKKV